MYDAVILSLVEGGACQRVPVLRCVDALVTLGARVEAVSATSDAEIDQVLARLDGPARPDGLTWPDEDCKARLVIAVESDGQLRHVIRRMVRRYAPAPSRRPHELPAHRTLPDLPPVAVLPLDGESTTDLAAQLGLPREPADVAAAVLGTGRRRLDLLRHDGGSVTLDGVLIGAATDSGVPIPWRGRVEVDDAILTDGRDPIVALCIANAGGVTRLDGLPLVTSADPGDGLIDVAIAVPLTHKPFLGRQRLRYEVRRARGRAVAVTPHELDLPFLDDKVAGALTRKRSWWIEPSAWSVYTSVREDDR